MSPSPPSEPPRDEFRDRLRRARRPVERADERQEPMAEDDPARYELDELVDERTAGLERDPTHYDLTLDEAQAHTPAQPTGEPGAGGGWPAWAVVDWEALEPDDAGGGGSRRPRPSVPPTPRELDDVRDQILSAASQEAAVEHTRGAAPSPDVGEDETTSAAAASLADEEPVAAPRRPSLEERPRLEKVIDRVDETTGTTRAEIVSRGGSGGTDLSLTPERLWELVKDAAWAAQEARERAARAEGESEVLRRELDRLREERRELTRLLAGAPAEGRPPAPRRSWWPFGRGTG